MHAATWLKCNPLYCTNSDTKLTGKFNQLCQKSGVASSGGGRGIDQQRTLENLLRDELYDSDLEIKKGQRKHIYVKTAMVKELEEYF